MLLQQSNFSSIPSSLKQRNPLLHKQNFPFYFPRSPNASTFRISSLGDIAQIAHNKVLIAAGVSMVIGQISKPFTSVFLYGKEFDIKALLQPGGFPSSHSSATVSCATFLGLERGLSDPIFGLAVVYAGLVMYDAQGVRREVGIHAKTVNKLLLQMHLNHLHSKHKDALINSHPDSSNPPKLEAHEKSLLSLEAKSLEPQQANASVLVKSGSKIKLSDEELLSSDLFSEDSKQISKLVSDGLLQLKETVGHTEVEVIAGAFLGFLVGLAVYNFK